MIDLFVFFSELFIRYIGMFFYFFTAGRAFILLLIKFISKSYTIPDTILETKNFIFYPIFGLIYTGNILVLLNFFIPLKSTAVKIFLILILLPNLLSFKKEFNFKNQITFNNLFYVVLIPSILLISTSDINFHYDAAYYHLNNQNWLRETNLVVGFVNIFWPFGMSSIYEYISAVLWVKDSLIYLHFLSLMFIHFLYAFLYFQIFSSRNVIIKNGSLLLLMFSILDNFGFSGGRNGFIYIQEVGKQDTSVAILLIVCSFTAIYQIKKNTINPLDLTCLSLISLFIIQIKVSGVYIIFLYAVMSFYLIYTQKIKFKNILLYQLPSISLGILWVVKNYLMTGCLIFPASLTCINNFEWYIKGSTEKIEEYTSATSYAYLEYFTNKEKNFIDWFREFFYSENYSLFSEYYRSVYSNFLISLIVVIFIKVILFKKNKNSKEFNIILGSYLIVSFSYLILYGPIPRYTIGILCSCILFLGFYTNEQKFRFNNFLFYLIFLLSIGMLPRLNSYNSFFENKNIALYNPQIKENYSNEISEINWEQPQEADRCWINLSCRFEEGQISVSKEKYFYIATKK